MLVRLFLIAMQFLIITILPTSTGIILYSGKRWRVKTLVNSATYLDYLEEKTLMKTLAIGYQFAKFNSPKLFPTNANVFRYTVVAIFLQQQEA